MFISNLNLWTIVF